MTVRTRMAPSPTGEYHIGHIRTLLYNFALAHQNNGQFIIRIEDTDQKRLVPGAVSKILSVIKDYGLSWDEGPDIGGPYTPYTQTERLPIYQDHIQKLLADGHAYYCFCTPSRLEEMHVTQKLKKQLPKYDRLCLNLTDTEIKKNLDAKIPFTIRLKVPDREIITFNDAIRGLIKINTADIDDQILIKSNGIPTYHFAAAVDDHLMNITHVLRGDEWISSTPKAILLYRYFGWELPIFAHLPVFLDPSGQGKMSKRKGTVSAQSFLDDGYLPQALLNFLMLLGWNPGTEQEIFSLDEFIKIFSLDHVHTKQPIFDRAKLDYINGLYIRQKSDAELVQALKPFLPQATPSQLQIIIPLIKERITKLSDATTLLSFIWQENKPEVVDLTNSGKTDVTLAKSMLVQAIDLLKSLSDFNNTVEIQDKLINLIKSNSWKTGDFFMVFRVAITGSRFTPPIVESLSLLSKDTVLSRLQSAITLLS